MTGIFYEHLPVAEISADGPSVLMRYDGSWLARRNAFPVSLTMPLSPDPVGPELIMPWLANLLPESQLSAIGQMLKVSPQDVLGLLERIGRDTAGAFSVGTPRVPGAADARIPVETEADLERIISDLPSKPFLVGETGVSMSLAGVQEKLPVHVEDGRIGIPTGGTPSTHILKPDSRRLAGSVWNEAYCMTLAALCGLATAAVTTGRAGSRSYLLVERYDRYRDSRGALRRTHQEDLAQLLGLFPVDKYEKSSRDAAGPSLRNMFGVVGTLVSPGERLKLLDGVVFNVLVSNTDSHAKNYSVLVGAGGSSAFAPLYDIVCAAPYPFVDRMLPQRIGGRSDPAELNGGDWTAFAREVGLSPGPTLARVAGLAETASRLAPEAARLVASMPAGNHPLLERLVHLTVKRCRRISSALQRGLKGEPATEEAEEEAHAGPAP